MNWVVRPIVTWFMTACLWLTVPPTLWASDGASPLKRLGYESVRGRTPRVADSRRLEGELHFERIGKSRVQPMGHFGDQWSGDTHLLWDGTVGESMETAFEVPVDGIFDLAFQMTVAPDYGRFDAVLNGQVVQKSIDLYGPRIDLARLITLKNIPLTAGRQSLSFRLVGSNEAANKFRGVGYLMGLDFLQLTRKDKPEISAKDIDAADSAEASDPHASGNAVDPLPASELQATFRRFCYQCHSGDTVEGDLDLARFKSETDLSNDIKTVRTVRDAIQRAEMPPQDERQPSNLSRSRMVVTLNALIRDYLERSRSTAPIVMRRMNRLEYNNAVRDLLQLRGDVYPLPEKTIRADQPYFDPATGRFPEAIRVGNRTLGKNQVERQILSGVSPFAIDLQAEGGFNNRGAELSISPILMESFLKLGQSIVSSPEFDDYCKITDSFFSAPADTAVAAQKRLARQRLETFLHRAFRRPLKSDVIDRYHRFFAEQLDATGSFRQSMKGVVAAALASPNFIYLSAAAREDADETLLDPYDLATRLSFFLWSSIPDDSLLAAAKDGSLTQAEVLRAQVSRMLEDPRSRALSQNFARQWLRLDQLVTAVPDFERFPQYYSRIGCEQWKFGLQTMIEPLLLFESIMVEDRSIMLLIDSPYSYRSDQLQSWYANEIPFAGRENTHRFETGQQVYRKRLVSDRRQGGVITSAATLTMTSAPLRTSPIARGAWVATVIFNQPPPPPPDSVPPIEADDKTIEKQGLTLRQRLIQHQVNASCVGCHSKIDPLGFALENYDAVGRWRDQYSSGLPIDATGALRGTHRFHDVVGLKDAILENPEWFTRAFCEHLLSYALGRELEVSDIPAVDEIVAEALEDRGQFTTIVHEIVLSHPFRYRAQQSESEAVR